MTRVSQLSSNSTGSPKQGVQSTIWDEAVKIAGADPDFHRRDLYEAIAKGDATAAARRMTRHVHSYAAAVAEVESRTEISVPDAG